MAERRRNWEKSGDDLPVYLARPGTADQVPRQKHGGLFCSIEDAFESKTIDFDALSVGQRGSRTPRSTKRLTGLEAKSPASDSKSSPAVESPTADKQERKGSPQVKIGTSGGKEILQNLEDEKVGLGQCLWQEGRDGPEDHPFPVRQPPTAIPVAQQSMELTDPSRPTWRFEMRTLKGTKELGAQPCKL
ncbi:fibroblast growth factor receptor 2 [Sarotherodon galilaeus]